ncbi:protein of unknown function [Mesorhizobium albiziae]|uniref:Uncharacterized protein n=1 Tax=Neomesorhizobium albiziae TaxID=335020 RepID=A0A1I4EDZ5_9HYPH|nr:PAAR-like domain-containing protein [Mesorhizobium albiziae]GLS31132.1 hypothetical protein GCM10007937_28410 [Mesorhizobium albiziae]SFL02596.1 protein of unknown function [Mesorhizobium albiziae]
MAVFANGLHLACKAQSNKVIAAFPDTCFTPPQTPATPPGVPVPYPSFGMDSDTDQGTGTVKVGGKTITHKNKSYYTKTTGTEAGCAPKKNLITSVNRGKEYAHAWSGNVKADKEPVSRFSDMCTNDHASPTGGTPPQLKVCSAAMAAGGWTECLTGSYSEIHDECKNRTPKGETHHIVPDMVYRQTTRATTNAGNRVRGAPSLGGGMCICLTPGQHSGLHSSVNQALAALPGTPAGTAMIGACAATAVIGLRGLTPELHDDCIKEAATKVANQTAPIATQSGRTTLQPPAPNSPAFNALRP